ncbi:6334_t:CDS:2, partial [Rhizophagus irregularis]
MSSETNKDGTVILLDKSTVETLSETSLQADDFEHQSQPESTNTENKNFFKGWKKTIFVDDSSNIKVTFHVYLPSFEFVEGYPIVVGNIEELGNWENPIVKLKQQEGEYLHFKSNYWYSDPISIPLDRFNNYEVKYKYAFFIPKPRIEGKSKFSLFTKPKSDEKKKYNDDDPDEGDLYSEENEQLRLLEKKTGFKFDIAQKFQSDLLPGEFYDALNITMTAAIRLNVINRSFDWLKLFKVASIIDPHFSFIEVIQDLKYSNDRMKNFLIEYTKSAKSIVNQIKNLSIYSNIGRWLFYNCNSFEILRFIWTDIIEHTTERDIQLIKYFCLRVEQLISSSHATSLNNYYRSGSYDSNDSNFIYEIYYYLSIIFPIVGKHAKIFKDLLDVAA